MSQPAAERRISRVFSAPDRAVPGVVLSAAEIRFFKGHGFLVKHALLDHDAMAEAVECFGTICSRSCRAIRTAPGGATDAIRAHS
jgi:hypothetical protein